MLVTLGLINSNMRCIEILMGHPYVRQPLPINSNMRCIEMMMEDF